jgi:hypothetical protein
MGLGHRCPKPISPQVPSYSKPAALPGRPALGAAEDAGVDLEGGDM